MEDGDKALKISQSIFWGDIEQGGDLVCDGLEIVLSVAQRPDESACGVEFVELGVGCVKQKGGVVKVAGADGGVSFGSYVAGDHTRCFLVLCFKPTWRHLRELGAEWLDEREVPNRRLWGEFRAGRKKGAIDRGAP